MLPFNFLKKIKKEPLDKESYLSLSLTPDKIAACIWDFDQEVIRIRATEERHFETPDNLIHEAAVAIDTAAETAASDVEKAVFGLSQSYFEGEDLADSTVKLLKKLTTDLELEAQAFVSLASSISHFLKITEGVTPQAVLIGLFQSKTSQFCEVHLAKNNRIVTSKTASVGINFEKITQLLDQLKGEDAESLPSRLIIYGNPEEELLAQIQKAPFEKIFIHQPKIDILDSVKLASSVAYAQAADILGHDPILRQTQSADIEKESPKGKADGLGFVAGVDILQENPKEAAAPSPVPAPLHHQIQRAGEEYAVEFEPVETKSVPKMPGAKLPKFKFINPFKKFKMPQPSRKLAIILAAAVLLALVALFVVGQTLTSAQVVVKVTAQQKDGSFQAKVTPGANYDVSQSQIPGTIIAGKSQGNAKTVATGSKKIGNKAKGTLTIQNWTNQAKTFPAGTEVITKDGLKFTTDNSVNVLPGTAHPPGEAKTTATAQAVGANYNIAQGQDLSIVGQDSDFYYSAKSDTAFSGGDEKQATVVSQADLDKLEKSLTASLTQKAKDDLNAKAGGAKVSSDSLLVKINKKNFDKKPDDEASIINLDIEIEVNAIAYTEDDLKKLISDTSQNQPNFESRPQDIEAFEVDIKRVKDTLNVSGKYRAKLIPKLNQDQIASQIEGKSEKVARAIIKQNPQVSDVLVSFSPALPLTDSIPKDKSKIKFKIEIS